MPTRLLIAGLCLLVLGVACCRAGVAALRTRRWTGGSVRGLLGLLLLALAGLAAAISVGLREYHALTLEVLAATVTTEPLGPQRFRATIVLPDQRLAMYDLAGDALYMDAHILKWHPWMNLLGLHPAYELDRVATVTTEPLGPQRFRATIVLPDQRLAMYDLAGDALYMDAHILKWHPWMNLLGLHTAYELDRVAGRYNAVADERGKPHTAYELARPAWPAWTDLFWIARRHLLGPLVDAEYGSAAFVASTKPARYEVRVSTTGLLMRPVLP